ncbi:hypothetical protein FK220_005640 [Flavobacteriaceae bacterium TP-CH-4]|uniref:Uncharacterized protein n=1 Tax=Pelagihabitans pacificus TaxID=2696054 RepID=A0A967AWD7_9FLAO|nr:hypothetical protein [Pelagihabitans pacificus]NHF58812.1 hypothetical protein [Pelagihabitans pacificus]
MPKRFFFLLILAFHFGQAQKVVKKSIVHPGISLISIDAHNCFDILVETVDKSEMMVEAKIDGEYNDDLMLNLKEEGSTLTVAAAFLPSFVNPNDKLSAHKVVSIALHIQIPQYKNVTLYGTSCNVVVSGNYRNLDVSLSDGQCTLDQVAESAEVITQSGDIFVLGSGARIIANSKYGFVENNQIPKGDNSYILNTVTGDIHLSTTE